MKIFRHNPERPVASVLTFFFLNFFSLFLIFLKILLRDWTKKGKTRGWIERKNWNIDSSEEDFFSNQEKMIPENEDDTHKENGINGATYIISMSNDSWYMSHRSQIGARCSCWRIFYSAFIFTKVSLTLARPWLSGPEYKPVLVRPITTGN